MRSIRFVILSLTILFPVWIIAANKDSSLLSAGVVEVCKFEYSETNESPYLVVGILTKQKIQPRKLTVARLPEKWPNLSPNGVDVAFFRAGSIGLRSTGGTVPRKWDVYIVTRQGTNERRITNMEFRECGGLDFSPDGSNLVFSVRRSEYPKESYFELRFSPVTGIRNGDRRYFGGSVVLHNEKHNMMPLFSPDGHSILFIAKSRRSGTLREMFKLPFHGTVFFKWELCIMNIETKKLKVLDISNVPIESHRFLPDTGEVTYTKGGQTVRLQP